jgi:hypothetical protein
MILFSIKCAACHDLGKISGKRSFFTALEHPQFFKSSLVRPKYIPGRTKRSVSGGTEQKVSESLVVEFQLAGRPLILDLRPNR